MDYNVDVINFRIYKILRSNFQYPNDCREVKSLSLFLCVFWVPLSVLIHLNKEKKDQKKKNGKFKAQNRNATFMRTPFLGGKY